MTIDTMIPRLSDLNLDNLKTLYSTVTEPIRRSDEVRLQQTTTTYKGGEGPYPRQVLRHPGGSAIVPLHGADVVCVAQYRPALEQMIIEIPAGRRLPHEKHIETARRELREETGLGAATFKPLLRINAAPCCSDWEAQVFIATGLYRTDGDSGPDLPTYRCLIALRDIESLIHRNLLVDGKTIASLFAARHMID
jgi:ADP-ribose pyrophosphatase YjhB (NUDIX family)